MELTGNITCTEDKSREAVLSKWYDEYATDVLRLCCFYLGSRADGEDSMQETFLKAWRHMERFQGRNQCSPRTWLMKIAINTCRDMQRGTWLKHINRRVSLDQLPEASSSFPEDTIVLNMEIAKLPVKLREVVLLYYYGLVMKLLIRELVCRDLLKERSM